MQLNQLFRPLKPFLSRTFYREGSVRTIVFGPSRGLRYRIFPGYGWAPICGGWEPTAQRLMQKHIGPGSVAYDIGANYGIHTLLMARQAGPQGHVYAFEPVEPIANHLRENVAMNRFTHVTCVDAALSDQTGTAHFFRALHDGAGHLAPDGKAEGSTVLVKTVTLDEFVFQKNNRPPQFMKMDVEGSESRVLSGGLKVLESYHPILLIDLHTPKQDLAVGDILSRFGYTAYRTRDNVKADLTKGWPSPDGLWDQLIAFPA